jgi:hypothetical protein
MPASAASKKMKEDLYERKEATTCNERKSDGAPAESSTTRPRNPRANVLPTEGDVLEVDGKFKSEYASSEAAMKAGLELKKKYPHIQVRVYDAKERTRTMVELPE